MTTVTASTMVSRSSTGIVVQPECKDDIRNAIIAFLDMAGTATGQRTFYNKKADQRAAMEEIHTAVFGVNRGLYAAMLCLPGVMDISIQLGVDRLMSYGHPTDETNLLTSEQEASVIAHLAKNLPPQRMLKMCLMLRDSKASGQRARKFIKRLILSNARLPLWCVKYRTKVRDALRHAWGGERTGAIRQILCKKAQARTREEKRLLKTEIDRFLHGDMNKAEAYESLCYAFGHVIEWKTSMLKAVFAARDSIEDGKKLPMEVLEGIRGRFWDFRKTKSLPDGLSIDGREPVDKAAVLQLTKNTMTTGQRTTLQRAGKKAKVEIEFDPNREEMSRLYVYALTELDNMPAGRMKAIRKALDSKAKRVANGMPLRYGKVAIVVDNSRSMYGSDSQKFRPIAVALSMRDIVSKIADDKFIVATNGVFDSWGLIHPSGHTDLATAVVEALKSDPDAVFLITDGYENAPAGRVDEVLKLARKIGIDVPVYQVAPVMGSESAGIRQLSSEVAPMPVSRPESLGLTVIRAALNQDIERGIVSLMDMALPKQLEAKGA